MTAVITDAELTDLQGLAGAELVGCTLRGIAGERVPLDGTRFEACRFVDCHLRLATVSAARFTDVSFLRCTLTGIDWTAADWPRYGLGAGLRFVDCTLDLSTFHGLALPDLVLHGCSAIGVDLGGCTLTGADLRFSDLTDARVDGADLGDADLTGATGYDFPLDQTRHRGLAVSLPEAAVFLQRMGLVVRAPADRPAPEAVLDGHG